MKKFQQDAQVQYNGCGALLNLLIAKQKSAALAALDAGAINLSMLAMKQHPDDDDVQQSALLCLQNAITVTDATLVTQAIGAVLKEKMTIAALHCH
jgi:hypothetical protein